MARKQLVQKFRPSFTRLARPVDQLMREQLDCRPVTAQQCYTLEAPMDGPQSMEELAALFYPENREFQRLFNGCDSYVPAERDGK